MLKKQELEEKLKKQFPYARVQVAIDVVTKNLTSFALRCDSKNIVVYVILFVPNEWDIGIAEGSEEDKLAKLELSKAEYSLDDVLDIVKVFIGRAKG